MFDQSSCAIEQLTNLPVCLVGSDVQLLHASISQVVDYMATHHIPRDEWDAPYVYRDYLPDRVSGNDVAALSRIAAAAHARGITLPPVLAPLYSGQDAQVTAQDVYYASEHARILGEILGPLLSAMREADRVPCKSFPWAWVVVVAASGVLLGAVLTAPSRKRAKLREEEEMRARGELPSGAA
jgi:hypothetical protein